MARNLISGAALLLMATAAVADIAPNQVLVVYNSAFAEGTALKNAYLAAHPTIPSANVFALNDATLGVADISYSDFVTKIRNPIRNFIAAPGAPDPPDIISIVLMRPFPHRVLDTDFPTVGDNPGSALVEFYPPSAGGQGDATYASVDAELVLLWQNLDAGEAGGTMDSKSDNCIVNPYHTSAAQINSFTRANIQTAKTFTNVINVIWDLGGAGATRLTPGDMYLVCRIDGSTLADATAEIQRAQDLYVNKSFVKILLDEYSVNGSNDLDNQALLSPNDPFLAGNDYEETRDTLIANGWNVRYDGTFDFISSSEETSPLIAYASYGENHKNGGLGEDPPGDSSYLNGFRFPPGAMFNTIESYNARGLNGLAPLYTQEQVAHFITNGGTFGVGMEQEPFAFSVPDNEFLFVRMLVDRRQWAEAAYMSLPCLSWQHVVVGDPLARMNVLNDPGLPRGDLNGDGRADGRDIRYFIQIVLTGLSGYRSSFPTLDPIARADFTGDFQITTADLPAFVAALIGA